jgi:DNA-binding NtrC family response regulator
MGQIPKILLVDLDDARRENRIRLLQTRGYDVTLRNTWMEAERADHEDSFDLILISLGSHSDDAAAYSKQLKEHKPTLPVLLLTDFGVFVPEGTLSEYIRAGNSYELILKIAAMLAGSTHVREL